MENKIVSKLIWACTFVQLYERIKSGFQKKFNLEILKVDHFYFDPLVSSVKLKNKTASYFNQQKWVYL